MSKMKFALDVVTDLRSLANSIETLVNAIVKNQSETEEVTVSEPTKSKSKSKANKRSEQMEAEKEKLKEVEETNKQSDENQPTIEELRAAMADKNRDGHREEVKAILLKYGANKLTSLDPVHYTQVLKEAEDLR